MYKNHYLLLYSTHFDKKIYRQTILRPILEKRLKRGHAYKNALHGNIGSINYTFTRNRVTLQMLHAE